MSKLAKRTFKSFHNSHKHFLITPNSVHALLQLHVLQLAVGNAIIVLSWNLQVLALLLRWRKSSNAYIACRVSTLQSYQCLYVCVCVKLLPWLLCRVSPKVNVSCTGLMLDLYISTLHLSHFRAFPLSMNTVWLAVDFHLHLWLRIAIMHDISMRQLISECGYQILYSGEF